MKIGTDKFKLKRNMHLVIMLNDVKNIVVYIYGNPL